MADLPDKIGEAAGPAVLLCIAQVAVAGKQVIDHDTVIAAVNAGGVISLSRT